MSFWLYWCIIIFQQHIDNEVSSHLWKNAVVSFKCFDMFRQIQFPRAHRLSYVRFMQRVNRENQFKDVVLHFDSGHQMQVWCVKDYGGNFIDIPICRLDRVWYQNRCTSISTHGSYLISGVNCHTYFHIDDFCKSPHQGMAQCRTRLPSTISIAEQDT